MCRKDLYLFKREVTLWKDAFMNISLCRHTAEIYMSNSALSYHTKWQWSYMNEFCPFPYNRLDNVISITVQSESIYMAAQSFLLLLHVESQSLLKWIVSSICCWIILDLILKRGRCCDKDHLFPECWKNIVNLRFSQCSYKQVRRQLHTSNFHILKYICHCFIILFLQLEG